ncbi:MAG: type II toxin-antitoxin system prevent-host-death family antitoxin [Blastochloris sp.]|nr:type II toxin-antitoxin system prevent-host-death family antitoxin [Blastochloris sp.]
MKTASVTELKNGLSGYLEKVQGGHRILVTDHQRPVAILERVALHPETSPWVALAARGLVALPRKVPDIRAFLAMPKARCKDSLTRAVSDDRDGR